MKVLTDQEARALYGYLLGSNDPKDVVLQLLFETGARVSEGLAAAAVAPRGASVTIEPLKGSLPREVLISDNLVSKLLGLPKDAPAAAADTNRRTLCRHFHRLTKRLLGRRVNLHALRHTAFTRLYRQTKDLLLVKTWAGHRSINSTLVYLQADKQSEASRQAKEGLAKLSV
jgi:integrase